MRIRNAMSSIRTYQLIPQKNKVAGQAMVETVVVMFVTMLLLFGIIQFGLIYNAKTVLNYATFEAARAAAVNYGSPQAIEYALASGLAALESSEGSSDYERLQQSQINLLDTMEAEDIICVERINPTQDSAHWIPSPDADGTFSNYIPNDHLVYRSAELKDGLSIQDANLLKIRVTYCHKLIVPFIATVIKRLTLSDYAMEDPDPIEDWKTPELGGFTQACYENDRIPIESQAIMHMQSSIRDYLFSDDCS